MLPSSISSTAHPDRRVTVHVTPEPAALQIATYIQHRISTFDPTPAHPNFVLGLPTGSTPERVYAYLCAFHAAGTLSFAHTVAFNMDEYAGLPGTHAQSYSHFLHTHLLAATGLRARLLRGDAPDARAECAAHEAAIAAAGGVDLFLCGLGRDAHVAFNEPGCSLAGRTRVVVLADQTRRDNARFFGAGEEVPRRALSVGLATVMGARELVVAAFGEAKARAVALVVEGPVAARVPGSVLQMHPCCKLVLDEAAAAELGNEMRAHYRLEEEAGMAEVGWERAKL